MSIDLELRTKVLIAADVLQRFVGCTATEYDDAPVATQEEFVASLSRLAEIVGHRVTQAQQPENDYAKLVRESFFRVNVGVPFDGYTEKEHEFLSGVANGDLVVLPREQIERLLKILTADTYWASHLQPSQADYRFVESLKQQFRKSE